MSVSSTQPSPLIFSLDASTSGKLDVTISQGQIALASAQASVPGAATQPVTVPVIVQSNGATLASASITVAPTNPPLATMPGQTYASDAWLAAFPRNVSGFTIFATNNPVYVGTQTGDCADFKTACAKAASIGSLCILFRRGGTYTVDDNFQTNGLSASQPFVVGSTPDVQNPRPVINSAMGLGNAKGPMQFCVIFGLDFYDPTADPANAAFAAKTQSAIEAAVRTDASQPGGSHLWIEDCRMRYLGGGLDLENNSNGTLQTVIIRRCTIDHCYGQRWGIYAYRLFDLLIDECILDHNGWAEPAGAWAGYGKNIFSHDAYLQKQLASDPANMQTRVCRSIIARAAAEGNEQRTAGVLDSCLFLANPIAGFLENSAAQISNCVVDGGGGLFDLTIGTAGNRGWGLFSNATPTAAFTNVLAINKPDPLNSGFAFGVQWINTDTQLNIATNATFTNCIVNNWDGPSFQLTSGTPGTIAHVNCDFPGIVAPGIIKTPTYVDATRCTAKYAASLGVAGVTDAASFLAYAAQNQRNGSWDARFMAASVNNWVLAGFTTVAA